MTPRSAVRTATSAVLVALTLLAACSDAAVAPTPTPVASILVTPAAHTLIVGQQATLEASPRASNGDELDRPVTWTSENEALATVSSAGVVTTLGVGDVTIRATSEGRVGSAVLTINPVPPVPVAEVRLSVDDEVQLAWDGTAQISATAHDAQGNLLEQRTVLWSSNKPNIATVLNGRIEAVRAGTATITAIVEGVTAQVGVRVAQAPVTEVTIEANTTGLEVGEVFNFAARITRANGDHFYGPTAWTSSAPAVARIDHIDFTYATIEAVAEGSATLTATYEGKSASLTVLVTARPTHDLIYNTSSAAAAEIFVLGLTADAAGPVKLNAGNVSRSPSPSPDGSEFVFAVSQPQMGGGIQNDLYIVNRNGMNMRWFTRMDGLEDQPRWSPDGTKILFHAVVNGRPDIYTINVNGTDLFNVTANTPAAMTDRREAAWSPDGSKIVFIGAVGGQHKVWTINANGTDARQVTTDAGFDMTPSWSPAGDRIAFVRYNAATPANGDDIMLVSPQGGETTRLALAGDQRTPAWSPDGKFIALSGTAVAGTGQQQLYTVRPDGTGLRLRTVNPAWGGGFAPAWIVRP